MYFMFLLFYYLKQRIFRNFEIDTITILIIEVKRSNKFLFEKFFDSSGRISVKKKKYQREKERKKKRLE